MEVCILRLLLRCCWGRSENESMSRAEDDTDCFELVDATTAVFTSLREGMSGVGYYVYLQN